MNYSLHKNLIDDNQSMEKKCLFPLTDHLKGQHEQNCSKKTLKNEKIN